MALSFMTILEKNKQKQRFQSLMNLWTCTQNIKSKNKLVMNHFYSKRRPKDVELNIDKSIRDNFNLLQIVN
jgi:methionyl-tRNA formyltransferase